ncbi:MAG: hypothetical protein KDN22_17225 [Verrucomicrobiae bacterium]|nr:hypothetical protein [Verrucomicrobiae bacterium]
MGIVSTSHFKSTEAIGHTEGSGWLVVRSGDVAEQNVLSSGRGYGKLASMARCHAQYRLTITRPGLRNSRTTDLAVM